MHIDEKGAVTDNAKVITPAEVCHLSFYNTELVPNAHAIDELWVLVHKTSCSRSACSHGRARRVLAS
jgi:hypothetical protein